MRWNLDPKRVYIAAAFPEERSALRALLMSLGMEVVGESTTWGTVLTLAPGKLPEVIVVSWELIAKRPVAALRELRSICPNTTVVVTPRGEALLHGAAIPEAADPEDRGTPTRAGFDHLLAGRLQVILAREG